MPPYAAIVSTVALAVSAASFYVSSLREVHSLRLGVVGFYPDFGAEGENVRVLVRIVILNRGNRSETANSVEIELGSALAGEAESYNSISSSNLSGPYILKSEEVVSLERKLNFSTKDFIEIAKWNVVNGNRVGTGFLYLTAEALLPSGKFNRTKVLLAKVEYDQKNSVLSVNVLPWFFDHFNELLERN